MLGGVAARLKAEADASNERRLLVLAGSRDVGYDAVGNVLADAHIDPGRTVLVSRRDVLECERLPPDRAGELLGTTRAAVVLDCHDLTRPNAVGQSVGAVDGGGLLVLLTPPLGDWPDRRDEFDERLAVPPYTRDDLAGNFRHRLVETLRAHRGVEIVDVDRRGLDGDGSAGSSDTPQGDRDTHRSIGNEDSQRPVGVDELTGRKWAQLDGDFPSATYEACVTADQARAVGALECLRAPGHAVVLEADRGRGKSSAAGLAAAGLATEDLDVLVTAPGYRNAGEIFVRAATLLETLEEEFVADGERPRTIHLESGGCIRYVGPTSAVDLPGDPDVIIVDEAAGLPVARLESLLAAPAVAFATTVHGYEGAGRGFSVRFRDRLDDSAFTVREERLSAPIRYAAGDPVEAWAFRALLLDARPPVDRAAAGTDPDAVTYQRPTATDLLADEPRLRQAFGLLVLAHYRTEPDDLARLLDAPNLSTRVLVRAGHVVAVALLAEEGGLDEDTRCRMYEGDRIRGNMVPDLLTAQLRDQDAADLDGIRVVRIATHPALRHRGLGSRLLSEIAAEFDELDWLGAGFGATPDLIEFWRANGYGLVHVATTRNETSGEYSALMLRPQSEAGHRLHDRHAGWFADRAPAMLSGPLRDADPDVVRAALAAVDASLAVELAPHEWRLVAGAAAGTAHLAVDPGPFRRLSVAHLIDPDDRDVLSASEERLLIARVLQSRPATTVAEDLGYPSGRAAMRALGGAFAGLVELYGTDQARAELDRLD